MFLYSDDGCRLMQLSQEARDKYSAFSAPVWTWQRKGLGKQVGKWRWIKHLDVEQLCKVKIRQKVKRLKMMLDEIGRERGSKKDGGGRVLQTRCSQAHTSSLCSDLLSVWILFRSNRPLKKDSVWFFFVSYLWHRQSTEMFSTTIPLGCTLFRNTVHTHCVLLSPDNELVENENKLKCLVYQK